jgi:hypothetical protein
MSALDPQSFNQGLEFSEDLAKNIGEYGKALKACLDVIIKIKELFGKKKTSSEQTETPLEASGVSTSSHSVAGNSTTETGNNETSTNTLESRISDCENAIYEIANVLEEITKTLSMHTDAGGEITKTISQQTNLSGQSVKQLGDVSRIIIDQDQRIKSLESRLNTK